MATIQKETLSFEKEIFDSLIYAILPDYKNHILILDLLEIIIRYHGLVFDDIQYHKNKMASICKIAWVFDFEFRKYSFERHGSYISFFRNGKPKIIQNYSHGWLTGIETHFKSDGSLKKIRDHTTGAKNNISGLVMWVYPHQI